MSFIIGVDVGGTFTDAFLVDTESQKSWSAKALTTPANPSDGVFRCLEELARSIGVPLPEMLAGGSKFAHGTTQTSNLLITRTGSKVGLIATRGFGDQILFMGGKGRVAGLSLMERRHFRSTDKPEPIVPRHLIQEVAERIDYKGAVITPLDVHDLERALHKLSGQGIEALAICFLWSFKNSAHERRALALATDLFPDLFISASSGVTSLIGEYERTATTVVNAYVGPGVREYLEDLADRLRQSGLARPLLILQSNGGVANVAETLPVNTIESGPAAGVVAASYLADTLGHQNVIATDVGGTTFKVSTIKDGEWSLTRETIIGQYSLRVPMIDVVSIGAGGGSVAWVDGPRLRVGPISAGADPGPACYARGGQNPTVTDADLVLGYLNPDYFLGGQFKLQPALAEAAIKSVVADPLFDGDIVRAAAGIRQVIDSQMADLIRTVTVERGHDLRDFVMLAYGGAGPVHCGAYAAELRMRTVIIPPAATVYSAFGAAVSDIRHTYQVSDRLHFPPDLERVRRNFAQLEERALRTLRQEGLRPDRIRLSLWADMRYRRQMHEVRVPLERKAAELEEADLAALAERYERRYEELYGPGAAHREAGLELVTFGLDALGLIEKPGFTRHTDNGTEHQTARHATRPVYWLELERWHDTPIYRGVHLRAADQLAGPAIVEYPGTTVVLHPGQTAALDAYLNVVVTTAP